MKLLRGPKLKAPELVAPDWAGDQTLLGALLGRVVLLDFFSYGDPAGLRGLRWVRALADQYRDVGLTVVGIHVPAYGFERPVETARREVWRLGIPYPVALDHGFEVFRAYENRDLPARYVIDAQGTVRGWSHGPGERLEVEHAIRTLLRETKPERKLPPLTEPVSGFLPPGVPQWMASAEIRFGVGSHGFGSPEEEGAAEAREGDERDFEPAPEMRAEGRPYLEGKWQLSADGVVTRGDGCSVSVVFEGASIGAVLSRAEDPDQVVDTDEDPTIELLLDGDPIPEPWMGADVEGDAERALVRVDRGSVFELVGGMPFGIHHLDARVSGPGVALHLLSFGTTAVPVEE